LLDWSEILADDVLDQCQLKGTGFVNLVVDQRWNGQIAGDLCSSPAPFAGDELESVGRDRPHDDRLQQASLTD
jgi:hypothetical protein